jgi:hypothetical protein
MTMKTPQPLSLRPDVAAREDVQFARIEEKGIYRGRFTRAEAITSSKGSLGYEFGFEADDGATSDFLTVWIENAEGKQLWGRDLMDRIMAVCRVRSITPKPGKVEKWDAESGQRRMKDTYIVPELVNKKIRLALIREDYRGNDGSLKFNMKIQAVFDYETGLSAREIMAKVGKAEDIVKLRLADRPMRDRAAGQGGADHAAPAAAGGGGVADLDDDIPF